MLRKIAITLLLLSITLDAAADGKMFSTEKVPPKIPYQRALILFKNGIETIILQSRYEISQNETTKSLGWVVPVPATPEIATMRADWATGIFKHLSFNSRPENSYIIDTVARIFMSILLASVLSFIFPFPAKFKKYRRKLIQISLVVLLVSFSFSAYSQFTSYRGPQDVDVIAEHHVGVYDVRVLKAKNVADIVLWLNANEFKFTQEDNAAFESYISKGWFFVVATISTTKEKGKGEITSEGLAAPLIIRFPHQVPIYPVVLTGTGNHSTEILIYTVADTKMSCDKRMRLRFAGEINRLSNDAILSLFKAVTPEGFFKMEELQYSYLCKFKDTLTPADMQQDIMFTPANDNVAYRESIIKW